MQPATFLAILAGVSGAAASPTVKRAYASGQCGIHIYQRTRANDSDWVEFIVKDANGAVIGHNTGGLADAEPQTILSYLPDSIFAKQPTQSHDIQLTYQDESFGSEGGCSVGAWSDGNQGTRQWDCGFTCN